jgi:hypothetical protein
MKTASFRIIGVFLLALASLSAFQFFNAGLNFYRTAKGESVTVGGASLFVEGLEPFYLKIYNYPQIDALDELSTYIEARQASLRQLANRDPQRQIEVVISPSDYMEMEALLDLAVSHQIKIESLALEVFLNGRRQASTFVESSLVDFTLPLEDIKSGLHRLVPNHAPTGAANLLASESEFKVTALRGKISAADAVALNNHEAILLVDPITDLLDKYNNRAFDINVIDMPYLVETQRRLQE